MHLASVDKRTNQLTMVVKDIRALRDSFEPWLDEVWWKFAWTEIKNSSVKKYKSEQFRTWKDLDRETIFVYSINSFWIRLVVFLWIWIRSNCKIRSYKSLCTIFEYSSFPCTLRVDHLLQVAVDCKTASIFAWVKILHEGQRKGLQNKDLYNIVGKPTWESSVII